MILQIFAATIGVLGFAVLFHVPKKSYLACAFCGGISWFFYLALIQCHASLSAAAIFSTIAVTIIARILAVALHMPATIFLVSGIFPLVPGAGIYYTTYYLITDQWELFKSKGVETIGLAGAIALGMIIGSELPQKLIHRISQLLQKAALSKK